MWALGNVAGDSAKCHDIVHAHGAFFPLLQLFNGNPRLSLLRTATWSLSNFCRENPTLNMYGGPLSDGVLATYVV